MWFKIFLMGALAFCPFIVCAQENSKSEETEIFELSPFEVDGSKNDGYRATNATSGTRLNTPIKDLPMSLEVITAEFIEDTGATDLKESLSYSAGVSLENFMQVGGSAGPGANAVTVLGGEVSPSASGEVGDRRTNAISIRGFTAPFQQRLGFRIGATIPHYGLTLGATIDAVNIERNEILRGPGAMLYGIGVISGIVNVIPKTPLPEPHVEVTVGAGDYEYRRGTLDITGPLFSRGNSRLTYRVASAYTEKGDWTDYFLENRQYYTAQLQYEYGRKIKLLLEYQRSDTRFEGDGQRYLYDDLQGANNGFYRNEWNETYNWGFQYGGLDQEHRVTGPDTYYERIEDTYLANLTYTPNKHLSFNAGYFLAKQDANEFTVDVNMFNNDWGPVNVVRDFDPDLYYVLENSVDPDNPGKDPNDYKAVGYWWIKRPQSADTMQFRLESAYEFETPWLFSTHAKHSVLLGFHYIEDDIAFPRGEQIIKNVYQQQALGAGEEPLPINEDGDAFFVRDFFDTSPFRYNGELLAQPGQRYTSSTLWYKGYYGVYHGRFFNEKLTLITGYRVDTYQAYKEDWVRERFDGTNSKLGVENPTYIFNKTKQIDSPTFSLGYALSDNISIYGLIAGGVVPNTGQFDGNNEAIPPEETTSKEVGIKFDVVKNKISGTISVYQIRRENATWNWSNAPSPKNWHDSPIEFLRGDLTFNAGLAASGVHPQSYGVDWSYFDPADFNGWTPETKRGNDITDVEGIVNFYEFGKTIPGFEGIPQTIIYLDYNKLDESGFRDEIEAAFAESRTRAQPDDINPIYYRYFPGGDNGIGNNPSNFNGSIVTFTDEATGIDFQIFLKPTENWQWILSYAHTEREAVTGFHLVDAVDLNTDINYGTEYDIWVRDLGRDSFEDPTRPSTATGGGVKGLSLSFVPEDTASIWSNYKFKEGLLNGFEFGLGVIYQGSAQTSVPIGGEELASNRYRTPDTKALYRVNSTITYRHAFERFDLRISLNIYNLLETNPYHESRITYENVDTGGEEFRRSFYYTNPRSFRITAKISF